MSNPTAEVSLSERLKENIGAEARDMVRHEPGCIMARWSGPTDRRDCCNIQARETEARAALTHIAIVAIRQERQRLIHEILRSPRANSTCGDRAWEIGNSDGRADACDIIADGRINPDR